MQKVAGYSFIRKKSPADGADPLAHLETLVRTWIESKGKVSVEGPLTYVTYADGRKADYGRTAIDSALGKVVEHTLVEPTESGLFETHIALGYDDTNVATYVELRAAGDAYLLGPLQLDVRCPQIVRDLLNSGHEWYVANTPVSSKSVTFHGDSDGQTLVEVIWHPTRNLPIVALSRHEGSLLTANFADKLASDLSGLALVVDIDELAAWAISRIKGKEWSCYYGAIRLYWPMRANLSSPYAHPLWTRSRLLAGVTDPKDASYRFRKQLRKQIVGLSAFSVSEPSFFSRVRNEARKMELNSLIARATEQNDWQELAEKFAKENDDLRLQLETKDEQLRDRESQVTNLEIALRWRATDSQEQDVQPESEIPPATVAEAVQRAREIYKDRLVFGSDVNTGIQGLAQDAGPPEKILKYLSELSQMAEAHKTGPLGKTIVQWLRERGVIASVESETIRNSASENKKRTWNDGTADKVFDFHLKPNDAVSPDRCVRIYFVHDEDAACVRIGWVGRHP